MRSTLVGQSLIDEYLDLASDAIAWGRMWNAFFKKESLLSDWARTCHEEEAASLSGEPMDSVISKVTDLLDAAFMTGLFIGERRLEIQRGESDWIKEAYDADPKEPNR